MRYIIIAFAFFLIYPFGLHAELTIEQCVKSAEANYPVVKKYDLLKQTKEINLSDINKGWLPRINVYGQLTGQNIVPAFPDALSEVLEKMGQEMRGLGKVQYKIGVDISQTIWDGGVSKVKREMAGAEESMRQAALDVEIYAIRERVENLYFAILLIDEQIAQSRITTKLLEANLEKLRSMFKNGTAMQTDLDMVEAQLLSVNQGIMQAQSASSGYRKTLAIFTGENLENQILGLPEATLPVDTLPNRPELRLFGRQLEWNALRDKLTDVSLRPHVGFFSQAYYGYPGFNYFQSMANRDLSFNIIAGIKVSWNIDSFYTRKNAKTRTALNASDIMVDREIFLFNLRLKSASQTESIRGIRDVMKDDAKIVELRGKIRKAAESQLENGVIDVTTLLTKISDENTARLMAKYHEIQLLQEIYKLKNTLDR